MAIQPLPADTARLLGAASQVTTPVDLVKELVENAIDACATTVEVRVSPNTVDKIEVRDDGHGILPADFAVLGCRGHTSKLTRFEDLPHVVGRGSLGFRGEGLASANNLGYVAITTRHSGADGAVASTFRLVRGLGGVAAGSLKPASAPIGTTVAVTCLFAALPVRRKTAVQAAGKTLAAIKALLCNYALARPRQLRLVLRVFQQPVPVWQFLPCVVADGSGHRDDKQDGTGMREAVCMLFGHEAARLCQEAIMSTADLPPATGVQFASSALASLSETGYVFEAFLPKSGADLAKVAFGGFVSVDGRPLTAQRHGTIATKLLAIFWTHLGKTVPHGTDSGTQQQRKIRDAFLRLNIKCPVGSYDANVETSKTDVLFADERGLCDAFERFCIQVCGEAAQAAREQVQIQGPTSQQPSQPPGCMVALGSPQPSAAAPVRRVDGHPAMVYMGQTRGKVPTTQNASVVHTFTRLQRQGQSQRSSFLPLSSPPAARQGARMVSYRRVVPTRGLQTPPPSSPVETYQAGPGMQWEQTGDSSAGGEARTDAASQRAYRQTTILFRAGQTGQPRQVARSTGGVSPPTVRDGSPDSGHSPEHGFVHDSGSGGVNPVAPPVVVVRRSLPKVAQRTADDKTTAREERPSCVMEVRLPNLARTAARFAARETAGCGADDMDGLSVAADDMAKLERRVKDTIAKWLAKQTRAMGKGQGVVDKGTVKIAFYLRQSLKKRTSVCAERNA